MQRALCGYSAPEHACVPMQRSQLGRHCAVAVVSLPAVYSVKSSGSLTHNIHHSRYRETKLCRHPRSHVHVLLSTLLSSGSVKEVMWIALLASNGTKYSNALLARSPSAFHSDIIFRASLAAFKVDPLSSASFRTLEGAWVRFHSGDY